MNHDDAQFIHSALNVFVLNLKTDKVISQSDASDLYKSEVYSNKPITSETTYIKKRPI